MNFEAGKGEKGGDFGGKRLRKNIQKMYNYSKISTKLGGFVHKKCKKMEIFGTNLHFGIYKVAKKS